MDKKLTFMENIERLQKELFQECEKLDRTDGYHLMMVDFDTFTGKGKLILGCEIKEMARGIVSTMQSNKEVKVFWEELITNIGDELKKLLDNEI